MGDSARWLRWYMIHDTWYSMVVLFPINSTKKWKDRPNGSCVTGMCGSHHFLEPGLLSFRNLPKRTSPKGTAVAIQNMFHKSTSGRRIEFLMCTLYMSIHVYIWAIYIYIHCHLCTIVDQYIHQHLIYIHKSFTEWFTRLKYLMTDWDLGYPVITPVWKMRSLSRHQKFIQIHYSSWSSLKIWCRFSAWFSMWRENLLEIISSTRSWPERIWYTIEQRHVRLLPPAEKASIATSSDPVVATVTSLGVGTTMWDVSTNVLAWQIIRQWFFGIVSKDQNHSKSINLKKLNRNATSGWWPGKIRHPWAVWRCPWWCPDL